MSESKGLDRSDYIRIVTTAFSVLSTLGFGVIGICMYGWWFLVAGGTEDEANCNPEGLTEEEARSTARHEAGHTVVVLALHPEWFERTDVFPRGVMLGDTCATGITSLTLPLDFTRDEVRDQIAIAYGGYAADIQILGQPTSGASRDIRIATLSAIEAVDEMGMGEGVPPYRLDMLLEEGVSLGGGADDARSSEIRRLLDEAFALATFLLEEHREEAAAIADALADSPNMTLKTEDVARVLDEYQVALLEDLPASHE